LDLDGEVLHAYWADAITWVRNRAACSGQIRILDLGAGTGVATIALAQRFADAEVIAVDVSGAMLGRVRDKSLDLGLAHRVRTVCADLDGAWPPVGPVDVCWASMSLHHLADPERVLRDLFATTRPGGLVAVAEFAEPLRFLPSDLGFGRPGLETRLLDALSTRHASELPHLGADWPSLLRAAGFAVVGERPFAIDVPPPQTPATVRYAVRWLERLRPGVAPLLSDDDRRALDTLLDGDGDGSLQRRDDVSVRGVRTVTLAARGTD
jgi:SAM-dependent methyltransferase